MITKDGKFIKKRKASKSLRDLYAKLEDIVDAILIEESKMEKGKNLSLEKYKKQRELKKKKKLAKKKKAGSSG